MMKPRLSENVRFGKTVFARNFNKPFEQHLRNGLHIQGVSARFAVSECHNAAQNVNQHIIYLFTLKYMTFNNSDKLFLLRIHRKCVFDAMLYKKGVKRSDYVVGCAEIIHIFDKSCHRFPPK